VDAPKIRSTVENELKLAKPKIESEFQNASKNLEQLRQNSTGTITNAKQTIHTYLDDLVDKAKEFGVDKDEVIKGIHNVRDEVVSKLNNDQSTFKGLNDLKRMLDNNISTWKRQAPVTDTVKKAEQETLRGVRARIQDLENKAEPAAKAVNDRMSKLIQASEVLEKKFPNLDTVEKVASSYAAGVRDRTKELAWKTVKATGILGTLGIGGEIIKNLVHAAE
jgi:chromosome segregation ATPase